MEIEKSRAILKCFIDLKCSVWFTLGSENEQLDFSDLSNLLRVLTAGHFSVLKTLTGYRTHSHSVAFIILLINEIYGADVSKEP